MDVFKEASEYLQSYNIAVTAVREVEPDLIEDVFQAESDEGFLSSPVQTESIDLPHTPVDCTPAALLERRLVVLRSIMSSERLYLNQLETLLTPMKALRASASTSQPVLSSQQLQAVFYQVPELRDLHSDFYTGLKARLDQPGQGHRVTEQPVGDLFLKMVSQLGVYCGFIDNYKTAVEIVRTCTQTDQRFRTLAESMMSSCKGPDNSKTKYTFEALLYKPLDRITKTTLVLHDLLKHTPLDHPDQTQLQEALRISGSFLSGVNEETQCKRAITLTRGVRRQLMRDGFVVDLSEGERSLRHLFLYTDLLLCVKLKQSTTGKQTQYRFCWYLPLAGLRLHWGKELVPLADLQCRIGLMRAKMYHLREELKQQRGGKGTGPRTQDRSYRKLQQCELWLLAHSPVLPLELHSSSGKSHTIVLPSLYEMEEWREAIEALKGENVETVPPDLLTLTNSCVKLRMTQQPYLQSHKPDCTDQDLCGTLSVAVHSACGLQLPGSLYVRLEVDGYPFFANMAQTRLSLSSLTPQWEEEFSLQVDGARCLRVLCVLQPEDVLSSSEERVLARGSVQLDPSVMLKKWKRFPVSMSPLEVSLSLKYSPHPLQPPSTCPAPHQPVFSVPIGKLAQQEGVLVPNIVRSCVEEVERRGLNEVGIYRISGAASDIQALRSAFNISLRDAVTRLRSADVNAVSGTLKLYFRELPEPLIPTELFQSLAKALDVPDRSTQMQIMLTILQSFPDVNRNTFLFLLHHLKRVEKREEVNKMSLMNLATVFGPCLVRPPPLTVGQSGPQVDISQEVVVQVQVMYFYLQCQNLWAPRVSIPLDIDEDR